MLYNIMTLIGEIRYRIQCYIRKNNDLLLSTDHIVGSILCTVRTPMDLFISDF